MAIFAKSFATGNFVVRIIGNFFIFSAFWQAIQDANPRSAWRSPRLPREARAATSGA
jgi:hypothetical protein